MLFHGTLYRRDNIINKRWNISLKCMAFSVKLMGDGCYRAALLMPEHHQHRSIHVRKAVLD